MGRWQLRRLFYRGDRVSEPATLPDLYAQAETAPENAMLLGLSAYEGLTTNFLEVLYSAGGEVLDDSGDIKIDSKETRAALELLKGALDSGAIDPASLTYDDGGARKAFESGAGALAGRARCDGQGRREGRPAPRVRRLP